MAVRIRLRRIGKRPHKRPFFRVSVMEARRARDSACIEELGYYNPINGQIKINLEKFELWVKKGAKPTEAVESLVKRYKKQLRQQEEEKKDATTS